MRFEAEVAELGAAQLKGDGATAEALKESIISQVSELPTTVNVVAKEAELIDAVQHTPWWTRPQEADLQDLAKCIAPLMRYRQTRSTPMVHLDITDLLAVKQWIEFGPDHEQMPVEEYRTRAETYIRDLVDENPVLGRIQAGGSVSDAEILALADLLERERPHVTEALFRIVYDHKTAKFIQFIRHILGIEALADWSETITRAFDTFIAQHNTLTALQIQFLQVLRTFIVQNGKVEKKDLIVAPFTQLHPHGIRGLFQPSEINEILQFTQQLVA